MRSPSSKTEMGASIRIPDPVITDASKGFPAALRGLRLSEIAWQGLTLADVETPLMTVDTGRMRRNEARVIGWARRSGIEMMPHGKTTMTPALFRRQLEAGAWGITLATATQCEAAYAGGVRRLLMANQLVGASNMARISALLDDAEVDFYCTVDSADNVRALGAFFAERGQKLQVLIELGVPGGRCGCRDRAAVQALADLIAQEPALLLAGIEGYEGVIHGDDPASGVRSYARELVATADALAADNRFDIATPLITASGSAWYDIIAETFAGTGDRFAPLLRPGCYLTHDHGIYRRAQVDIRARHADFDEGLRPALEIWAHVQSTPEPGCAITALGKRDIAFDADLPVPLRRYRPGSDDPELPVNGWTVTGLMDQHAFVELPADADVRVGDIIAFGASHPCLTFDKWRWVCMVDDDDRVLELLPTAF